MLIGEGDDRDEDLYLTRDSGVASVADHDLVAVPRNYLDVLIDEVERLREALARSAAERPQRPSG